MRDFIRWLWKHKIAPTLIGAAFSIAVFSSIIGGWNAVQIRQDVNNHTSEIAAIYSLGVELKDAGVGVKQEAKVIEYLLRLNGVSTQQIQQVVNAFCHTYIPQACAA